eukprot:scaffold30239_cov25-Tisochrysis_lutea.AAC.1
MTSALLANRLTNGLLLSSFTTAFLLAYRRSRCDLACRLAHRHAILLANRRNRGNLARKQSCLVHSCLQTGIRGAISQGEAPGHSRCE